MSNTVDTNVNDTSDFKERPKSYKMSLIIYNDYIFKYLVYCIKRNIREIKLNLFHVLKCSCQKTSECPFHLASLTSGHVWNFSLFKWWMALGFPLCFSFSKFVKCSNVKAGSGSWPCKLCWLSDQIVRGIVFWSFESSSPIQQLPRADTFGYLVLYQRLKWVSHCGRCGTLILPPGNLY